MAFVEKVEVVLRQVGYGMALFVISHNADLDQARSDE